MDSPQLSHNPSVVQLTIEVTALEDGRVKVEYRGRNIQTGDVGLGGMTYTAEVGEAVHAAMLDAAHWVRQTVSFKK